MKSFYSVNSVKNFFLLLCAMLSALCFFASGCCSTYMTSQHNNRAELARMVKIQANNNGATLGVDLLNINSGYFAAWSDNPLGMAGATLGDLATGFLAYKLYDKATATDSTPVSPTIQTSGGDVYYIQGNQNNIDHTRSQEAP